MLDLVDERAYRSHRRGGILEVHVVTGAPNRDVVRAQPSDPLSLLFRCEVAPRVVLASGDHEHRASHSALLFGEELDVEGARDAEPEHRIGLPHPTAIRTATASVPREMIGPRRGQARVLHAAMSGHVFHRGP